MCFGSLNKLIFLLDIDFPVSSNFAYPCIMHMPTRHIQTAFGALHQFS
jgi:hypothetical protein